MRWLVLFAALSLFAQDDDLVTRHAAAAAAAMQSGDYASAEQHNRIIVRLRPQMAEAEANLGLSCFLQNKYEAAVQAFEAGLKRKPGLENARLFLGISRFKLNQPSSAVAPLRQYVAKAPRDFEGQYYLGLSYLALGQFADAERALVAARGIDPRNTDVLYHLTQCYLGEARQDPARRDALARSYQQTVEAIAAIDPDSYRLGQLRAGFYAAEGKNSQAIQELEKLLRQQPKARGIHYTLGCLYTEQRQYVKALEQFQAEMQLDAPYPRTWLQLGHVYVAMEKPEKALPVLEKALKADPDSRGLVWVDIARAYRVMNQPDKAAAAFEKAITLGENTSSVYYQLGVVAKKAGNTERAREAFAISQKLRNNDPQSKAASSQ